MNKHGAIQLWNHSVMNYCDSGEENATVLGGAALASGLPMILTTTNSDTYRANRKKVALFLHHWANVLLEDD